MLLANLKGYSTRAHEGYQISEDGISSGKFILELNGKSSSITPNNMKCDQWSCPDKTDTFIFMLLFAHIPSVNNNLFPNAAVFCCSNHWCTLPKHTSTPLLNGMSCYESTQLSSNEKRLHMCIVSAFTRPAETMDNSSITKLFLVLSSTIFDASIRM